MSYKRFTSWASLAISPKLFDVVKSLNFFGSERMLSSASFSSSSKSSYWSMLSTSTNSNFWRCFQMFGFLLTSSTIPCKAFQRLKSVFLMAKMELTKRRCMTAKAKVT